MLPGIALTLPEPPSSSARCLTARFDGLREPIGTAKPPPVCGDQAGASWNYVAGGSVLQPAENAEDLIQQGGDTVEVEAAVQQVRHCAEQVTEQIAGALLRGDGQMHRVEIDD